jgi:hypothetical protein
MSGNVFLRHELKYLLDEDKKRLVMELLPFHMSLDRYGKSEIRSLYFDTDDYLLVRRSIQKPIYKEKLRLRSYGEAKSDKPVFVELKRKYDSVVYKRRSEMTESEALFWLTERKIQHKETQILREIEYFLSLYPALSPKMFLSYDREAFYDRDGSDLRITFDDNILARGEDLTLEGRAFGKPLLDGGLTLMEIKCSGGIPLWLTHLLSEARIYKTSYSKYGVAYEKIVLSEKRRTHLNV